jgi:hypothetical protein
MDCTFAVTWKVEVAVAAEADEADIPSKDTIRMLREKRDVKTDNLISCDVAHR